MLNAIILENEEQSAKALMQLMDAYCNEVKLLDWCTDIEKAIVAIKKHNPDILFLDVELDNQSGLDILKFFPDPKFEIIFTTAFDKYTLQAIRHSCLEYLLKPIDPLELINAIQKCNKRKLSKNYKIQLENLIHNLSAPVAESKIAIPTTEGITFIRKTEIVVCEAENNYTNIFSNKGEKITCSKNLSFIEELIADEMFYRCHKSYLVNINYVKQFDRRNGLQLMMDNGKLVNVSIRKKDELLIKLGVVQKEFY